MRAAVGLVAAVLLVAGCAAGEPESAPTTIGAPMTTEGPVSSVEPSTEVVAQPSPEPSVTAPPLPVLATEQTPEGAVAFAEWWFATLNYATATGDTAGLRAASDPRCGACSSYLEEIDTAYSRGGRMEGGTFDVDVQAAGPITQLGVVFPVFIDAQATQILDDSGGLVTEYPTESVVADFTAAWIEGRWVSGGLVLGPA